MAQTGYYELRTTNYELISPLWLLKEPDEVSQLRWFLLGAVRPLPDK